MVAAVGGVLAVLIVNWSTPVSAGGQGRKSHHHSVSLGDVLRGSPTPKGKFQRAFLHAY